MSKISLLAEESFVVFDISKTLFGLSIEEIEKIHHVNENKLFQIPKSSPEVLGLYRDKTGIVPVIELGLLLHKHKAIKKYKKESAANQLMSSFKMKIKGISLIFAIPSKPDVIGIDVESRLEKKSNNLIKSKVKPIDADDIITELNLEQLFNNVEITKSRTSLAETSDDDLDLSQYLLDEE